MSQDRLRQRVAALVSHFEQVQAERMAGIPLLNAALRVEAVGFVWNEEEEPVAEGVLITPWFMSLWRLPASPLPHSGRVGRSVARDFGGECFDFMTAFDPVIGYHESCALFSPMNEFDSQERARETALAALSQLRVSVVKPPPMPGRRAFLFRGVG
jgi:[NiFe] hydrogenase assembly HybE family chaperone